jgi:trigger factor
MGDAVSAELEPIIRREGTEPGSEDYSVEVPEAALRLEMEKEFEDLARSVRLPGFRKGKAPRHLIVARFRDSVREEAVEKLVSRVVWKTLQESEVVPFFDPVVDDLSAIEGEPVRFRFSVDAWPRALLKRYQGFELRKVVRPLAEEDLEAEMRALQEANLNYIPVSRPAIRGDQLVVCFQRFLENGNAFGKRAEGAEILLAREETPGPPGVLEKALLGAEPGSIRTALLDFPADYASKSVAGRKLEYRVEVKEVRERALPVVDDSFAVRVLGEGATAETLREKLREVLARRAEEEAERRLDEEIIGLLVRENAVQTNERLIERLARSSMPRLPREEDVPPEKRAEFAKEAAALLEEHRVGARRAIQKLALLTEIANREKLEPEGREIEATRRAIHPREDPSLTEEKRREEKERLTGEIRRLLRERNVLRWIREHSTVS